jgi:hypothetical protein
MITTQNKMPRFATEDELEALREYELSNAAMGEDVDELSPENWQDNKPYLSFVVDEPTLVTKIAGQDYSKLLFAIWSAEIYVLYGWKGDKLEVLPADSEHFDRYMY